LLPLPLAPLSALQRTHEGRLVVEEWLDVFRLYVDGAGLVCELYCVPPSPGLPPRDGALLPFVLCTLLPAHDGHVGLVAQCVNAAPLEIGLRPDREDVVCIVLACSFAFLAHVVALAVEAGEAQTFDVHGPTDGARDEGVPHLQAHPRRLR